MPGELWMRVLKLMILPLVIMSVISGTASMDPKSNGKISLTSFIFILTTNFIGCFIAVILVLIIKPGGSVNSSTDTHKTTIIETQDVFADLLRNIFPDNIVSMTISQTQTTNEEQYKSVIRNDTNGTRNETIRTLAKTVGKTPGTNLLGVIMTSLIIGIATGKHREKTKSFLDIVISMEIIFLQLLRWLLWLTPLGVMSLILVSIAEIDDVTIIFKELGIFVALVTAGIVIHQILVLPAIFFVIVRRNPYPLFIDSSKAWLICFATTSTAVSLPEMLNACEEGQGVQKRVSRFVIPFCVALNSDGSALFITASAVFVSNMAGTALSPGDYVLICILTAISTLALPSVPSSSIVVLVMVLTSINVPTDGISLLFAVEWYLDRIRTTSNCMSHCHCAVVTNHICRHDLENNKSPDETYDDLELRVVNQNDQ